MNVMPVSTQNASKEKWASRMRKGTVAALAVALACAIALAVGCSPQASSGSSNEAQAESLPTKVAWTDETQAEAETTSTTINDFLNNDSGIFPDNYNTNELLNAGNRGCNSCHEDLWQVSMTYKQGARHILTDPGFEKNGKYSDCEPCHHRHGNLTGPYFGDLLHAAHYSNAVFVENNGNCWSCHAIDSAGAIGDYQFMLWDDFYDTAAVGGYPTAGTDAAVRGWISSRGFNSYYITGMTTEENPQIDVTFSQDVTDEEDVFVVQNWGDDLIDFDQVATDQLTLSVEGVNNPRTFTYEEILAMPHEEVTAINSCATNGIGGLLNANIPLSGVPMSYIIEQCGGLVDGINAVTLTAADGWSSLTYPAEVYLENTYVATEYYGHELTVEQGYPWTVACCGLTGAQWVKHCTDIEFSIVDNPSNPRVVSFESDPKSIFPVNAGWFDNDGMTYKLGDTISLKGAAWSWPKVTAPLDKIAFSFDMGVTWTEYNVNDVISDFDENQWVTFDLQWTPEKAGTYEVKIMSTDTEGNQPYKPITLFLTVEE